MNFEGTKLRRFDPVSVTEFLKRITTFTHFKITQYDIELLTHLENGGVL